jgi:hypothetical protein
MLFKRVIDEIMISQNTTFKDFLNNYLLCASCNKEKSLYIKGFTFLNYIPNIVNETEGLQLPPRFSPVCNTCLIDLYYDWIKIRDKHILISLEETKFMDWMNVKMEGIVIYRFTKFTQYTQSYNCNFCKIEVNKENDKLIAVLEDYLYFRYQDTYHYHCFIKKFIQTEDFLSLTLNDIKNIQKLPNKINTEYYH